MIRRPRSGSIQSTHNSSSKTFQRMRWCSLILRLADLCSTLSLMLTTIQPTQVITETSPEERLGSFLSGSPTTSPCNGRLDKPKSWDKSQLTAHSTTRLAIKLVQCQWSMRPVPIQDIHLADKIWQSQVTGSKKEISPQRLMAKTVLSQVNPFTHSHARCHPKRMFPSLTQTTQDLTVLEEALSMKPIG